MLLKDNSKFEHKEAWMEDCQKMYLKLKIDTEDYLREIAMSKEKENRSEVSAHTKKNPASISVIVSPHNEITGTSIRQGEKHPDS